MISTEYLPLMSTGLFVLLVLPDPLRHLPVPEYFLWLAMLLERDGFGLTRRRGQASETPAAYAPSDVDQ
jgi:hypothetical protein